MAVARVVGDEVGDGRAGADDLGRVPAQAAAPKLVAWTLSCPVLQPAVHTSLRWLLTSAPAARHAGISVLDPDAFSAGRGLLDVHIIM